MRLASFARVRHIRHALLISLLILRKKNPTVLQSTFWVVPPQNLGEQQNVSKGSPNVFPIDGIFQTEIRVLISSKPSLKPGSRLRDRFLVNGTNQPWNLAGNEETGRFLPSLLFP